MPGMDPTSNRLSSQKEKKKKTRKKKQAYFIAENLKCKYKGIEKMAPFSDVSDGSVHVGNEQ